MLLLWELVLVRKLLSLVVLALELVLLPGRLLLLFCRDLLRVRVLHLLLLCRLDSLLVDRLLEDRSFVVALEASSVLDRFGPSLVDFLLSDVIEREASASVSRLDDRAAFLVEDRDLLAVEEEEETE